MTPRASWNCQAITWQGALAVGAAAYPRAEIPGRWRHCSVCFDRGGRSRDNCLVGENAKAGRRTDQLGSGEDNRAPAQPTIRARCREDGDNAHMQWLPAHTATLPGLTLDPDTGRTIPCELSGPGRVLQRADTFLRRTAPV